MSSACPSPSRFVITLPQHTEAESVTGPRTALPHMSCLSNCLQMIPCFLWVSCMVATVLQTFSRSATHGSLLCWDALTGDNAFCQLSSCMHVPSLLGAPLPHVPRQGRPRMLWMRRYIDSSDTAIPSLQVLYNTAPTSYTASCTPVTAVQVGQSVIPPGTNISTTIVPPAQVTLHAQQRPARSINRGHAVIPEQ